MEVALAQLAARPWLLLWLLACCWVGLGFGAAGCGTCGVPGLVLAHWWVGPGLGWLPAGFRVCRAGASFRVSGIECSHGWLFGFGGSGTGANWLVSR